MGVIGGVYLPVVARPTINGKVEHQICMLISAGLPLSSAARVCNVPPRTVRDWLHQGQRPGAKPHWRRFAEGVEDARREHQRQVLVRLEQLHGYLD